MTVTDNSGAADIISHPVIVTDPPQPNDPPTADFTSSNSDLTALFTDTSTDTDGTVVSWDWDFGDSGTSTAQNPSHAYAAEGTYTVWLTATDDDGDSHSVSHPMTVNDPPPPPDGGLYMSFDGNVTLGGTAATEEDILLWDGASAYSMAFDGSDVGLSGFNIDGFDVIGAGQVLISFESAETVPGVGAVDDSDIVLFTGTLGSATSGTFSMYFDGSDVSLSSGGEDVVALALLSDGSLLVSTNNSFSVAGLSGVDEDVIRFTGTFGPSTSGSFSMYFDGSDVAMSDKREDIDALGTDGTDLYFSTIGNFNALGLTGADEDVLAFSGTFFPSTSGSFASFWDGSANGTTVDLNGLDVVEGGEDTTPPDTSIDSGPVEGSVLGVSSASLGFSATEPGSTFECSVDGGAFSSCASPVVLSGLVDGAHSFAVAAIDGAGNTDLSPASRGWSVDTTAPGTSIDSGPVEGSVSGVSSASLGFSATEPGSTFECSVDGGAFSSCASPVVLSGLVDGAHSFAVAATDATSNTDLSPATRNWVVDTDAPGVIELIPAPGATGVGTSAFTLAVVFDEDMDPASIDATSFTLETTAGSVPVAGFVDYDVAGRAAALEPTADLATDTNYTATLTGVVTDVAGNPLAVTTWTFQTELGDTTPPGTSIDSGPVEGSVLGVSSASLGFSATEPGSTFECSVDGAHSFAVAATDATSNTDLSPATRNWTVDESDILHWDGASTYTQTFDGSDVGLGGFKISGFDVIGPDQVLLTFVNSGTVPGLGNVDDSDVVLFTGTLGPATSGTFTMYFDGSDVQLDQKKESIRALTLLDDGSLLISTQGSFSVSGLSGEDKDVFRFTGVFGSSTSGSFSMYLDGSDVGMSNKKEDVDALASDGTDLYFSTTGDFSAGGVVATAEDVITFSGTFGDSTSGTFGIFWDAAAHGIAADIVGLDLG